MLIVASKYLVPNGFMGITIFPFVFLKKKIYKTDKILINHENIHLRQQLELGILFFFLWYLFEFIFRFIVTKNKQKAYRDLSFEREAYTFEKDLEYISKRKWYSFLKFL